MRSFKLPPIFHYLNLAGFFLSKSLEELTAVGFLEREWPQITNMIVNYVCGVRMDREGWALLGLE